jgi:hypothetical protein
MLRLVAMSGHPVSVLLAAAVALTACTTARHPAVPLVRTHAQKDLDCPEKKIHVTAELGGRYRATGCGRTALYHSACEQLSCEVGLVDETAPAWRDRPEPGSLEEGR